MRKLGVKTQAQLAEKMRGFTPHFRRARETKAS